MPAPLPAGAEPKVQQSFRMKKSTYEAAKARAHKQGVYLAPLVEQFLEAYAATGDVPAVPVRGGKRK